VWTDRQAWDRRLREPTRAYEAFRRYRDAGPLRSLAPIAEHVGARASTVRTWSSRYEWAARAVAWDDEVHRLADQARLEAIRTMHDTHQRAARGAIAKALAALNSARPEDIPAYTAVRLLELGTRLEQETLTRSVEELQGVSRAVAAEDPWEAIVREFQDGGFGRIT
jgi:Phage terminase small subunit